MFSNKNLSVISYANGWTMWHYVDHNLALERIDDNFFKEVRNLMHPGDKILINVKGLWVESIVRKVDGGKVYLTQISKTPLGE